MKKYQFKNEDDIKYFTSHFAVAGGSDIHMYSANHPIPSQHSELIGIRGESGVLNFEMVGGITLFLNPEDIGLGESAEDDYELGGHVIDTINFLYEPSFSEARYLIMKKLGYSEKDIKRIGDSEVGIFVSIDEGIPSYSQEVIEKELKRLDFMPADINLKLKETNKTANDYPHLDCMIDDFSKRKLLLTLDGIDIDEVYDKIREIQTNTLKIDDSIWDDDKNNAKYIVADNYKGVNYIYNMTEQQFINDFIVMHRVYDSLGYRCNKDNSVDVMTVDEFCKMVKKAN